MRFRDVLHTSWSPAHAVWMVVAIAALDYSTPGAVQVSALFVLPMAYAAWFGGRRWGFLLAASVVGLRASVVYLNPPPWSLRISIINVAIRFAVLMLVVWLVDRVAMQRRRLRILEGLLPICSYCKRIRGDSDEWQQIERYISTHSEAVFSHGVCPTCAKEHYGDLLASNDR